MTGDSPKRYNLGIAACDKCGELMQPGEPAVFVAGGRIDEFIRRGETLKASIEDIRYACHLKCWDHYEDGYE